MIGGVRTGRRCREGTTAKAHFISSILGVCQNLPNHRYFSLSSIGWLWASIGDGKVLCRQEGEWRTYDQSAGLPFAFVSCLAEDANGTVWAGSLDSGLYYLEEGRFKVIKQADGLSADDIRSLKLDREGKLWVGTRTGGLNRLTQGGLMHCGARQGLTNDFTRAVAETATDEIWVGTTGGGVYRGTPSTLVTFQPKPVGGFYAHVEPIWPHRTAAFGGEEIPGC